MRNPNDIRNFFRKTSFFLQFPRIPFFGRRTEAEVTVERVLKEEEAEEEAQASPSAEESGECTETQHENVSSQGEEPRQEQEAEDAAKSLSDESFRTAIIAKDSEIICLKTENAVRSISFSTQKA